MVALNFGEKLEFQEYRNVSFVSVSYKRMLKKRSLGDICSDMSPARRPLVCTVNKMGHLCSLLGQNGLSGI